MKPIVRPLRAVAFCCISLIRVTPATAQQAQPVQQPQLPRWEAAAQVGWFNGRTPVSAFDWNQRYDTAALRGSAAYRWNRHLTSEVALLSTGEAATYAAEVTGSPGAPGTVYRSGQRHLRTDAFSAGVGFQFLENSWTQPCLTAGAEVARESQRLEYPSQPFGGRPGGAQLPASSATSMNWQVRPFIGAGLKLYVSERAFVRTDLRSAFSPRGAAHVSWTAGVGVDF